MDSGYSKGQAQAYALADWGKGLGADVLGGMFSGTVLTGGAEVYNGIIGRGKNTNAAQTIVPVGDEKLNIDNTEDGGYSNTRNGGAGYGTADRLHGTVGAGVRAGRDSSQFDFEMEARGKVGQVDLSNPRVVLLSPQSEQTLTQRGIVNIELYESSVDNTSFSAALDTARNADASHGWAVTPKTSKELSEAGTRTFMDKNGSTGFAVASDGDIQAVFANKQAGAPKGSTKSTIPQAIALGGNKLDCYGPDLVDIYSKYGFVPVARTKFVAEYANPGWTPDKGSPDIFFMVHNGDSADTVVQNMGKYKSWPLEDLETLPLMEYDEAYSYRDSLLSKEDAAIDDQFVKGLDAPYGEESGQGLKNTAKSSAQKMDGQKKTAPGVEAEAVAADLSKFDGKILSDLNRARQYFIDYAKAHFPPSVCNKETGKKIDIPRKGLDKFLSGRISKHKYATGFHIPELIERAHKVDMAENYHVDQATNAATYEYFDSPIKVDGVNYTAHIRVKNSVMGDKYYGHTISTVEDIEIEPSARTSVPNKLAVQPVHAIDGSKDSISNPVEFVKIKPVDLVELDKETRKKVLDLQRTYEKHHRMADREEMERLLMEAFGKELDGVLP